MSDRQRKTRTEKYNNKKVSAVTFPIYLACINFIHDGNFGYLIRTAACFGARGIFAIGSVPTRKVLNPLSGSLFDFVNIEQFSNPRLFLDFCKENRIKLICAEITDNATSIHDYKWNFDLPICIIVGNETSGIPIELLMNSDVIYVPLPGVGACLNTSQTANILLYEAVKNYENANFN